MQVPTCFTDIYTKHSLHQITVLTNLKVLRMRFPQGFIDYDVIHVSHIKLLILIKKLQEKSDFLNFELMSEPS